MPRKMKHGHGRRASVPQGLSKTGVVVIAGTLVLVIVATGLGQAIAQNWIVPLYKRFGGVESASSPSPAVQEKSSVQESIVVGAHPIYAVQFGVFSTLEAAQSEAANVIARGAAGYIMPDDGRYRVLAAAYRTADDARKVRDNLKNNQSTDSALYTGGSSEVSVSFSGQQKRSDELKRAFAAFGTLIDGMFSLSEDFDRGSVQMPGAIERAAALRDLLDPHVVALESALASPGNHAVIQRLYDVLNAAVNSLDDMVETPEKTNVEMSAEIKYNTLDFLVAFSAAFGQ